MEKVFDIKIMDREYVFTGTDGAMYLHVAGLMAQVCPPSGTVPDIKAREAPAIVNSAPSTALAVVARSLPAIAPPAPPVIQVSAPAIPPPAPAKVREGEINETGKARAERDRAAMLAAGFLPDATVYAIGSQVNSTGVENARKYRKEWEQNPDIREPLTLTRDMVKREQRTDLTVSPSQLRFTQTGMLRVPSVGDVGLTRATLGRLVSGLKIPGGAEYLASVNPELRAHNLNHWLAGDAPRSDLDWTTGDVKLRLRQSENGPELYAIVGPGYTAIDVDTICESLLRNLPQGGRGTVFYDGARVKVDVQWASNVQPTEYVAGEVFRAGMSFTSSDTGGGALNGWGTLLRNLCLNLFILQNAKKPILHERHIGDDSRIRRSLAAATKQGEASISHFLDAWGHARRAPLATLVSDTENPQRDLSAESLTQLAWGAFLAAQKRDLVCVTKAEIPQVLRAFHVEPEPNLVGVVNAFTRFAHETPGLDPWRSQKIETEATALLQIKSLPWLDPTKHAA